MKLTKLISKTRRQDPPEAETDAHRLMIKGGFVMPLASGIFISLPLAHRSSRKIEGIIREEMDIAGSQELFMPALQPAELWQPTNRIEGFGPTLLKLKDRRNRDMLLAPTHEEAVTYIAKSYIQSYRDLPVNLYQIQTKFRDEARPRAGLIRVREFQMKDAYSFNVDNDCLDETYRAMEGAYCNIFRRCNVPVIVAEADSGAIGGKESKEFLTPTPTGEDTVIMCHGCGYTANAERAAGLYLIPETELELPLQEVPTPWLKTIKEVSNYLGIPSRKTLKTVFYNADGQVVMVTIRGDLEVNEVKLKNLLEAEKLDLADENDVHTADLVAGFASPVGLTWVKQVADISITSGNNFTVGANVADKHLMNANYPRDFSVDLLADIALTEPGHLCIYCHSELSSVRGVEVGHIFKLGTFFSEAMGATYVDREGHLQPIIMGCYGIGIGRLLAAAIEQNHDERGIVFPPAIAPYHVHLVALDLGNPAVLHTAEVLYHCLWRQGVETLYDERPDQSAGVKLADADLLGMPIRLVVSPRNMEQGVVELKLRTEEETHKIPIDEIPEKVSEQVRALISRES